MHILTYILHAFSRQVGKVRYHLVYFANTMQVFKSRFMVTQSPWPRTFYSDPAKLFQPLNCSVFLGLLFILIVNIKNPFLESVFSHGALKRAACSVQSFWRWSLCTSSPATLDLESGSFIPGGGNSNLSPIINFCKLQFIREKNDSLETLTLTCV